MTSLAIQTGAHEDYTLKLLPSERRAIRTAETLLNRINDYRKKTGIEARVTKLTGTSVGLFLGAAGSAMSIGHSRADYEPTRLLEELAITIIAGAIGYATGCLIHHFNYNNIELSKMERELANVENSPEYRSAMQTPM